MLNNKFETIFLSFLNIHYLARKIKEKLQKNVKKSCHFVVAKSEIFELVLQNMLKYMK